MGVLSSITAWMLRAKPFQSDPLDELAESMNTTRLLKRGKLQRYYRAPMLANCCVSYSDAVFFDSEYFDNLSSKELLAVGAHEFNHIIEKHDTQKTSDRFFLRFWLAFCWVFWLMLIMVCATHLFQ